MFVFTVERRTEEIGYQRFLYTGCNSLVNQHSHCQGSDPSPISDVTAPENLKIFEPSHEHSVLGLQACKLPPPLQRLSLGVSVVQGV